jgi:hypothetical protein
MTSYQETKQKLQQWLLTAAKGGDSTAPMALQLLQYADYLRDQLEIVGKEAGIVIELKNTDFQNILRG